MTSKQKHDHFDCEDIEKLAQRYLDSDLDEQEKKYFNEHLEYCLPCDKKIEFELKLKSLFKSKMCQDSPPNEVKNKLIKIIKEFD